MSEWFANFHFLYPAWLWLVLGLPAAAWWLNRSLRGDTAFSRLVDAALLPLLMSKGRRGRALPLALLVWCWLVTCLALAGPAWERLPTPLISDGGARVIALSLSDGMLAQDVKPNRLTRARFKIRDLLKQSGDTRNALIGYAGAAFVVAPMTTDAQTVTNLLGSLGPDVMPVQGDDTAQAIDLGVKLLKQAGMHGGDILLIAATAGEDAEAAARRAAQANVHVSVLAVGTRAGAPINLPNGGFQQDAKGHVLIAHLQATRLRAVASAGGGVYQPMRADGGDLAALGKAHGSRVSGAGQQQASVPRWRDRGPWLLIALLPMVAVAFRRGWLLLLPLALLAPSTPARAAGLANLWHNPDQRAAAALAEGHAQRAATEARDPAWRGAAEYRSGDYAAAAASFAQAKGATARYNYGNALAEQGKYQAALAAYDAALKLDPDLHDAAANRKAIKAWLKQQKKQQQNQEQNQQQKQGDKQGKQQHKPAANPSAQKKSSTGAENKPPSKPGSGKPDPSQKPQSSGAPRQSDQQAKPSQQGQPNAPDRQQDKHPEVHGDQPASAASVTARAAQQQAQAQQAQQALKKVMDKALKGQPKPHAYVLGKQSAHDKSALPQNMQQALQRVPDDPGSLLRRKFQLEYQRRQQGGSL